MQLLNRLTAVTLLLTVLAAPLGAAPKTAMCRVCVVNHGEGEAEAVKATRTWQGKEYGFCSEKCAKEFDANPAAYVEPDFPRAAPAFSLTDLAGKRVSKKSLEGKVVLLDFWATWCGPCKKSMPELQALQEKYGQRNFTVLGISTDQGDPAKVKRFIEERKYTYPVAVDSEKSPTWEAYGVRAIPAAFLLDTKGNIVAQWTGAPKMSELEAKLQSMLRVD